LAKDDTRVVKNSTQLKINLSLIIIIKKLYGYSKIDLLLAEQIIVAAACGRMLPEW